MAASKSISHRFRVPENSDRDGLEHEGGKRDQPGASLMQPGLMQQVLDAGHFLRTMRVKRKFGHLSRAPLKLLRLELRGNTAECDWIARAADPWDAELPHPAGDRHASQQALEDAIAIRDLLFSSLPEIDEGAVHAFRERGPEPELIIAGTVTREQPLGPSVRSLTMRAKLLGLRFWLEDGILEALQPRECVLDF